MSRYFRIILIGVFLIAVLLIVVLQYNSNRSINQLISGNESLLDELKVKNDLLILQTGVASLESKVRGAIISGNKVDSVSISREITAIYNTLDKLRVLESDQLIRPMLVDLNRQVNTKVEFNRAVLEEYSVNGKKAAEELINSGRGSHLSDSIKYTTSEIDDLHQLTVTDLIKAADGNALRAKTLGSIMALMASIAAVFTFFYVAFKVREQQQLIAKLNVSEKKAKEAAHLKENFLANMSHEIRTPMNAILGFTDLLQREPLDKKSMEYVQTIHRSGENLLAIINDILDLSKIEAGMMKIDNVPFNISDVVQSVEKMFSKKAAEKGITLRIKIDPTVPASLIGDSTRLTQILINLIGNAVKFTHKGEVALEVSNKGISGKQIALEVCVVDTGIGIAKDKLDTIFERFSQADDEVNRKYGGTGLGLSIVMDLVSLMGGTIDVQSTVGQGTRFTVQLPYQVSEEKVDKREDKDPPASDMKEPLLLNILVVEDNSINQNLVRHLFSNWQIKYAMADNGEEALDLLRENTYDLVLMDIQMPGMDGYTATEKIRKELALDLPVIAMTAHALEGEKEKCLAHGMDDYISKPLRQAELYELLRRYAGKPREHSYRFINLDYMREVSGGDQAYEKLVTSQFIEAIPQELNEIGMMWQQGDIRRMKQIAHSMKTTVSVMGLNDVLRPYLDTLEYKDLSDKEFNDLFEGLRSICGQSIQEAGHFLHTIDGTS